MKNLFSSHLLRLRFRKVVREIWRKKRCFNILGNLDSYSRRSRNLPKPASDCRRLQHGSQKGGNAFFNRLVCSSWFSIVRFAIFQFFTFSALFILTVSSDWRTNQCCFLAAAMLRSKFKQEFGTWKMIDGVESENLKRPRNLDLHFSRATLFSTSLDGLIRIRSIESIWTTKKNSKKWKSSEINHIVSTIQFCWKQLLIFVSEYLLLAVLFLIK